MHWSRIAVLAASCVLLTACTAAPQPSTPAPSATTPTPTFSCTPETGGTAYECSQFDYDQMIAKDKLYAEAEAVYRRFAAEDERLLRAGGVREASQVLLDTTTGPFLKDSLSIYRSMLDKKRHLSGGEIKLVSIKRVPNATKQGSIVALQVCLDLSTVTIIENGRTIGAGVDGSDLLYFVREDNKLKILGADGKEGTC